MTAYTDDETMGNVRSLCEYVLDEERITHGIKQQAQQVLKALDSGEEE